MGAISGKEVKILYKDGETPRVIRGRIIDEDDFLIKLERRDGIIRIGKDSIIKIDERKGYS